MSPSLPAVPVPHSIQIQWYYFLKGAISSARACSPVKIKSFSSIISASGTFDKKLFCFSEGFPSPTSTPWSRKAKKKHWRRRQERDKSSHIVDNILRGPEVLAKMSIHNLDYIVWIMFNIPSKAWGCATKVVVILSDRLGFEGTI